MTYVVLKFRYS